MTASTQSEGKTRTARLRVGEWRVDSARNEVSRGDETVRLEPKVVEVLVHLAARPGDVISREELLSAVWPGVVVGDDALTQAIIKLRKALGDDAHKPTYIETISKRGYRLIAPVETVPPAGTAPSVQVARRLAAILSADIAGYSRLMGEDEAATVKALKDHQASVLPLVGRFDGRVIDLAGDGILAEFPSAMSAVQCAIEIQRLMAEANAKVARTRRLRFRIGVNVGDVIHDDRRIYGDGINIAARIQALAPAGGLIVSQAVFEQVRNKLTERFVDLGAVALKNIREPVQVYQVVLPSSPRAPAWLERWRFALRTRQRIPATAFVALALLLGVIIGIPLMSGSIRMPWPLGVDTHGAVGASMPIVAILPLTNLSGDPQREYFTDGVTEDIITGLGRFSGLRVMSLNAVQEFKGKTATLQTLKAQLGARYIVKGSVREADRRLRVAVEMSDADKGVLLWSERYDGEGAQLFEIQDRIVRNIVGALHVKLAQLEQQRAFTRPTESLEAHDLVLRARSLLNQLDRRANREARALLAKARELAPDYGEVPTVQGEAEMQRALYGWVEDPPEAMKRAEDLARRTLANADTRTHARAHALISSIYSNLGRYEESLRHADLALAANPSDASALYRRAAALLFLGKIDEALAGFEIARRSEPQLERNGGNLAYAYYAAGRYGECLAVVETMLTAFPNDVTLRAIRTATLSQLGREDDARKAAEDVRRLSPGFEVKNFAARFADPKYRAKVHEGLFKAGME